MKRIYTAAINVLSAKKTTGAGTIFVASSVKSLVLYIATAGMGAGDTVTIKAQGSVYSAGTTPDTVVNFDAAQSVTNPWDYVQMVDLEDASNVDGDTGVTFSDANDVRHFEVNTNGLRLFTLNITANSDTTNVAVTAAVAGFND